MTVLDIDIPSTNIVAVMTVPDIDIPSTDILAVVTLLDIDIPSTDIVAVMTVLDIDIPSTDILAVMTVLDIDIPSTDILAVVTLLDIDIPSTDILAVMAVLDIDIPSRHLGRYGGTRCRHSLHRHLGRYDGTQCRHSLHRQLLKPALSWVRCLGHTVLAFIDDTLLQRDTEQDCQRAVMASCQVLDSLGFTVHPVKSVLQPIQRIDFLGFWLSLINMIVSLTDRKVDKIRSVCAELLEMEVCSVRHLAKIIGYLVAALLDGWVAPVFYIRIEIAKNAALSEAVVILMLP